MHLPDEILIEIFAYSNVPTLHALRLSCRAFRDIISAYARYICSEALEQDYSWDLLSHYSLIIGEDYPFHGIFEIHRRIQLGRLIAARALQDQVISPPRPVGALVDPSYPHRILQVHVSDMFEWVTMGLGIMWQLSALAKPDVQVQFEEYRFPQETVEIWRYYMKKYTGHRGGRAFKLSTENRVLITQIDRIRNLGESGLKCLSYALSFCIRAITERRALETGPEGGYKRLPFDELGERQLWTEWLLLRKGPDYLAKCWRSKRDKEQADRDMTTALVTRPTGQLQEEKNHMHIFYKVLYNLAEDLIIRRLRDIGFVQHPFRVYYPRPGLKSPLLIADENNVEEVLKELVDMERLGQIFPQDVRLPIGHFVDVRDYVSESTDFLLSWPSPYGSATMG
ncbi:hypothetical protein M011DRAFT_467286 [Sporormia fimetaria CBS 119925]|uniref:F-box domain-containing protein n=1 Tax=Sporormia fimetaria CBS 119925 TaxID=1340428 RepID=A0A6A6VAU2_9PLEO|nr:hypothetical protein M011DRAFT_467286 [Sporormia fimetaria CBS 119925]